MEQQSKQQASYLGPFLAMVFLFFIVGFLTTANTQFQGPLKETFLAEVGGLKNTFATLITFSWFLAYPLSGGVGFRWINRYGYKGTLIRGLVVMIVGLGLFFLSSWFTVRFPEAAWRAGESVVPYGFLIFLGFYYAYPIIDKWLKGNVLLGEKTLEEYKETPDYRWTINIFNFTIFVVINVVFWTIYHFLPAADYLNMGIQTYSILAGLFLLFYNGKRGYDKKWFRYFTYLYYPMHIALIALIFWLI